MTLQEKAKDWRERRRSRYLNRGWTLHCRQHGCWISGDMRRQSGILPRVGGK